MNSFVDTISDGNGQDAASIIIRGYTPNLSLHIKAAAAAPLSDDVSVQKWLLHPNADIIDQTLQAVTYADVDALATWFREEEKDFFSAARLWSTLGVSSLDTYERRCEYFRKGLWALQQVSEDAIDPATRLSLEFEMVGLRGNRICMILSYNSLALKNIPLFRYE